MAGRTPIIAANWKMHAPPQGWDAEDSPYRPKEGAEIIVFPTYLDVHSCIEKFLNVGAQYGHPEEGGAFTGDVSMQLLAKNGCAYVLCGHSERRKHHHETDAFIAEQVSAAIKEGLKPILCVGETAEERASGKQKDIVKKQLQACMAQNIVIAYEPVWAIGNGNAITPDDAEAMHAFIRSLLPPKKQSSTHILYGGSVKPENAAALIAEPDVDGFLVGGASLDPAQFGKIVAAC